MTRRLTAGEAGLARSVFGETIDYDRVRIATRRWGRPAITFGSLITFPRRPPTPADFSTAEIRLQAWLIHELTHVWQFQHAPLRTVCSWLKTLAGGGYHQARGYRYAWPLGHWADYNLEQQASMVEHAFMLRKVGACAAAPEEASLPGYEACAPMLKPCGR